MPHDRPNTAHVAPIATDIPDLQAVRIVGVLTGEDFAALSQHVLGLFGRPDGGDLLISFGSAMDRHGPAAPRPEAADAAATALTPLRNLAVVNAPEQMHALLDAVDKLVAVAIRSFESEAQALDWFRAARGTAASAPPAQRDSSSGR